MAQGATITQEQASPFVGGAPDQFVTPALSAKRASSDFANAKIMGWRRENGRVGVRNHVVILPVDDISNAACEAVANNVKGTLALPHAYGRLQFGEDLELLFRTLIGNGANPNVAAVVVIGIETSGPSASSRHRPDRQAGRGFAIEGTRRHRHDRQGQLPGARIPPVGGGAEREKNVTISDLWISIKCGESDTTTGLSSCPTVGNMYDKLIPHGIYGCFGETTEMTGAEHLAKERAASPDVAEKWYRIWKSYQDDVIEAHKTNDLSDSPADQGQHRRRPDDDRGEGARQPREDRPRVPVHRCARARRGARQGPRPLLHGHVLGCGGVRDPDGRRRVRDPYLPDRPGQRDRQPDGAGDQDYRQPEDGATMGEHIDLDVSGVLCRDMTLDEAGDALIDMVVRTANGRLTAAESLGHREFVDDQALPERVTKQARRPRPPLPTSKWKRSASTRRGEAAQCACSWRPALG